MLVTCKHCKTKIDRDVAFKIKKGKVNHYYCNENEYNGIIRKRELKDNTIEIINNTFGYKIINTSLYKELALLEENYGYEIIYDYIKDNYDYLYDCVHKDYNNEFCKIRYFFAILKNSMNDYKETIVSIEKQKANEPKIDFEIYEKKKQIKNNKKRRTITEIENELE